MGAESIALGQTRTGVPLQKLSTMRFHWSLRGVRNPVSSDGHITDATREWGTRGGVGRRDVKADEGNAEYQVGETGKTVQVWE